MPAEPTDSASPSNAAKAGFIRRSPGAIVACVLVIVALTALDLWSKQAVEQQLSRAPSWDPPAVCATDEAGKLLGPQRIATAPYVIIEDYLELHYAENCGAAFGFMRNQAPWLRSAVFVGAAIAAVIFLMLRFLQTTGVRYLAWAVPLVVSGAIGNLVDRIRYGYVVDFIRAHWQYKYEYPTFNVADCGITIGIVLLLMHSLFEESGDGSPSKKKAAAEEAGASS
ncbi:MAG: signal peptidase II [Polyangiales bacterium]